MISLSPAQPQGHGAPRPPRALTTTWRHAAAARVLDLLGWRSAAAWAYRRALRRHAGVAELHLRLGEMLGALERWDEAAHAFRHAARLRPRCAEAHGNLALALHRVGRDQAALEALHALCALHPRRAELHLLLSAWLRRRRQSADALRAFRGALAAEPAPPTERFFLGEALLGVEEWGALVADLDRARGVACATARAGFAPARAPRARVRARAWERARHVAARLASTVLARAEGTRRLARRPWRLALLVAGRWHARAGRAARAIRCFRAAQALHGNGPSRPPLVATRRRVPARPVSHVPAGGSPWLARRGPALS